MQIDLASLLKLADYHLPQIVINHIDGVFELTSKKLILENNYKFFTFSASNFYRGPDVFPGLIKYRFLNSEDTSWQFTSSDKEVVVQGLNYGNYILEVALNGGNRELISRMEIVVKPKFYQSTIATALLFVLLIVTSVLLTLFFLKLFRRNIEKKREILKLQTEALKTQLDSHFLFNVFQAISKKIAEGSYNKASETIMSVAYYLRNLLHINEQFEHPLDQEISFTKKYLDYMLEVYPNKFEYTIDGDLVALGSKSVPTMIMQPFLENAIKHGFTIQLKYPYQLHIHIEKQTNSIQITIDDNGEGISNHTTKKNHQSKGLRIINDKLLLFSRRKRVKGQVVIIDKKHVNDPINGVKVTIKIPL
ncbi:MAG: histidine kinase [Bacteroidetes bacterium]|nr:histidine kinase [Bacteroidota bacterium]